MRYTEKEMNTVINQKGNVIFIYSEDNYFFDLIPFGKQVFDGKECIKCIDLRANEDGSEAIQYFTEQEIKDGYERYIEEMASRGVKI